MNKYNFNFNKNDVEWYTKKTDILKFLELAKIDKTKTIWCPFDNKNSNFVKVLKEQGYNIIYSHISLDQDFYKYEPKQKYDLIISNPPFKGKSQTLKRLIQLNKPFAMIYGIQCFNSGGFVKELKNVKNLQLIFLNKRMQFFKESENEKGSCSFHSLWICNDLLDRKLIIE
ncbi:sugar-phosphate nucleotidyltransferase [Metamycoplasma buccale]|uniref:sugar-phosphate nucleotidyltransferase n=1 Tax=Metamycoplasma buccale TaxID=55602 RepID=UPI00398EC8AF